ncbi:mevalonate kinase [Candidatus Micrarchaeota archaeon]|nr:mevalonate kinase [Candidatus Micrarchaeota archaeon]
MKIATGTAGGKIILLGEHFAVNGCHAIALAISNKSVVEITPLDKISFHTKVGGTIPKLTNKAISNILEAMNIKDKFNVELKGDLPTVGGLGSSAAFCVSLTRALANYYGLKLTNEKINEIAYKGELAFHGNPSGLDNTIATYGGAIKFRRNPAGNKFEQLKLNMPLHFVLGLTGISSPTSKMVAKVQEFKAKNEQLFQKLFDQAQELVSDGSTILESENPDLELIGKLMNKNQELLRAIGVSTKENEEVIKIMLEESALGAKITGGGGGGTCLALVKDKSHADKIILKLKKSGFKALYSVFSPSRKV